MWDLPGTGLESVSPALAGGFLTTAPPGKSPNQFYLQPQIREFESLPPNPSLEFCHTFVQDTLTWPQRSEGWGFTEFVG